MFEVYKAIGSRKTYLVFSRDTDVGEALKQANEHYKTATNNLKAVWGYILKDELYFEIPEKVKNMVIVVYKKR